MSRPGDSPPAHRYVDMWAFMGVHPANLEFFQRLKMADDRQFGANMDVCGTVSEKDSQTGKWERTHIVGIRTDAWNPDHETQERKLRSLQQYRESVLRGSLRRSGRLTPAESKKLQKKLKRDCIMKLEPGDLETRRLVMKLFRSTGNRIRWVGSIEEITTREVHNSMGSRRAVLTLASNLSGYDFLTMLQENHRTFRIPSIFTFCYVDQSRRRVWYVKIKRKWISIGADFTVEAEGRKIGEIDGALIGFGYNAHVYVYEPELARDRQFVDLITLFATTVGYQRAMRRSVKRRIAATRNGLPEQHIVEDEEFWLLRNPRRVA